MVRYVNKGTKKQVKLNHTKQVKYLKNQKNIGFNIIDEKQAAENLKEPTVFSF